MSETPTESADGQKPIDPVAKGCGLGCLGITALFAVLLVIGLVNGGSDDEPMSAWEAEQHCEDFAEKRLRAPSTAKFDLAATGGPTYYTVTGTVDAENSFGAMLRSNITCELRVEEDGVYLESLTGLS